MRIPSLLVIAAAVATVSAALADSTLRRELVARRGAASATPAVRQTSPCPSVAAALSPFCRPARP